MALSTLPTHPRTGLRALGITPKGRIVWPILGAEDDPDNPVQPPEPTKQAADPGFPANTPVAEMSVDQQAAYWKHQARRHEDRVKAYGGLTPEQLADLRKKAESHDALEFELMSDKDKAVAEAAQQARWAAEAEITPRLVNAEFRVAAAGRIEPDRLATILEPLDLGKFLTDDGEVDTAKVSAFIDGIAPVTGTPAPRRGPSPEGHGRRESKATGQSVASGRDLYRARHPQKTT
jgi:hypothetical protein